MCGQSFKLFAVSDLNQVFEDGYNLPPKADTIKLTGIRGEILSGQFVIQAGGNLSDVTVEPDVIKIRSANYSMPVNSLIWNFVGSVPLTVNASNQPATTVIRKAPARFPDYLMAEKMVKIEKGMNQAVWLTLSIPESAVAGDYSGNIKVRCRQGEQTIPVLLKVFPLDMPAERHLKVAIWDNRSKFAEYHGIKEKYSAAWFGMIKKYADNMTAHRQNTFQVALNTISFRKLEEGGYDFDFLLFDKIAEVYWNTGKMDLMELGLSDNRSELTNRGKEGFSSSKIYLNDIKLTDSATDSLVAIPGADVIPYLLPALESHLRRKGWLDKAVLHICDEPAVHNAASWLEISSYIHKYAPDLRRLDAVCTAFVLDGLEVAVPKLDHLDAGYDIYKKWQDRGNELWFYTVGVHQGSNYPNKTIDMPVIDNRILHWLNYKYDASGYLQWGWNQWTGDPFKETGMHIGDAWHVYPDVDGVLNSIRWEQTRNGIQDYECFRMLEDKIRSLRDSLGSRFSWIDPRQRGKEIVSQVATSFVRHSTDPAVLYKARMELISEIMNFDKAPRLYVQTSPPENCTVINRSVVELHGWVEPGSEITINRQKIPVDSNGLFVLRQIVFAGDILRITAKKNNNEKVITRAFNVTF